MGSASNHVAVVGMAGRFPGARDVDELWRNLCEGRESIRTMDPKDLARAGVPPELLADPRFVPRSADLADIEDFDPGFFGFSRREAAVTDPQQRLLLELAWEAFEDAGHIPEATRAGTGVNGGISVGVFVGASRNDYAQRVLAEPGHVEALGAFALDVATSRDFLATRIAYVLGLRGPALTVQTACSTSLVAVHLACQSLIGGECDMALAGGVSIRLPQGVGYVHVEGGVASPDGHCRAFDARARGTVGGNGGALVLLRPLEDALADGDFIHAVILGTAVNNDGRAKIGFTAPSVEGQAAVIEEALAISGVSPDEIGLVEAHGTGTPLGDPIEVAGLLEAFRRRGSRRSPGSCPIGSIKSNLGHLDAAAGIAGFVKAALAVAHGRVPPSLLCERPNPGLGLERSPFFVATRLSSWTTGSPRRAGVSSFGIGGTNAHAVLEEPPRARLVGELDSAVPQLAPELAVVSARSEEALERATARLADCLEARPELDPKEVAWTLQVGRVSFAHRAFAAGRTLSELAARLRASKEIHRAESKSTRVAFLFPGQGSQFPGMGDGAYASEPVFRRELDRAAGLLSGRLNADLLEVLRSGRALDETRLTQPALFALEHALARLWISWGFEPAAMLGHSIGEYVAACLAGVLSLEDATFLVAERGRLMQSMPAGAMLAASLSEDLLREHLVDDLWDLAIASVNGPELCVASGPSDSIAHLESRLSQAGVAVRRLRTSHAFHSSMMDGALAPFREALQRVKLNPPQRPYLSNVTGTWIRAEEAIDASYWVEHLRRTVRLSAGLEELSRFEGGCIALEAGPGRSFAPLARAFGLKHVASMPQRGGDESLHLRTCVGRLWALGARIDWTALHGERPRRVRLPTYPFERARCWVGDTAPAQKPVEPTPVRRERGATSLFDRVAGVWRECLGLEQVAPGDDFFELGGSSLLAIQVRSRLESELAIEVALADVLEATRLEELVRRIGLAQSGSSPARRSPLVRLGTRGAPLSCVHGIDGDVLSFTHLAHALEGELALVALRASGLEAGEAPLGDVRELAQRYVEAVRKTSEGPYHLAGHSFGALVAFEMARILDKAVASLALLDARMTGLDAMTHSIGEAELLAAAREHLRRVGMFEDEPRSERRLATILAHARAAQSYRPLDSETDALLVLASGERAPSAGEVEARWRSLVRGELKVASVEGDHHSMLARPHVEGVARALSDWAGSATLSTHSIHDP